LSNSNSTPLTLFRFSQGATIAAALILYHQRRHSLDPPNALFKYAIFFSAAGIVDIDAIPLLENGSEEKHIHIPTLHVLGKKDELFSVGIDMSKICLQDVATVVTHDQGHSIPRDNVTVRAIVKAIEMLHFRSVVA
jgi:predicted esterase